MVSATSGGPPRTTLAAGWRPYGSGVYSRLELRDQRLLVGVGVNGREPPDPVLFGDVDEAEVGEERHAEPSQSLEALGIVEREREHRARLGVEALHFLGAAARLDLHFGGAEQAGDVEHDSRLAGDVARAGALRRPRSGRRRGARRSSRRQCLRRERDGHHDRSCAARGSSAGHDRVERVRVLLVGGGVVDADRGRARERGREQRRRRQGSRPRSTDRERSPMLARTNSTSSASSGSSVRKAATDAPVSLRAAPVTVFMTWSASSSRDECLRRCRAGSERPREPGAARRCESRCAVTSTARLMTPDTSPLSSKTGESTACTSTVVPSSRVTRNSPSQFLPLRMASPISDITSGRDRLRRPGQAVLADDLVGTAAVQDLTVRVRVHDHAREIGHEHRRLTRSSRCDSSATNFARRATAGLHPASKASRRGGVIRGRAAP